jgi:hypothetical protein
MHLGLKVREPEYDEPDVTARRVVKEFAPYL